jgi:hypothetical protein
MASPATQTWSSWAYSFAKDFQALAVGVFAVYTAKKAYRGVIDRIVADRDIAEERLAFDREIFDNERGAT